MVRFLQHSKDLPSLTVLHTVFYQTPSWGEGTEAKKTTRVVALPCSSTRRRQFFSHYAVVVEFLISRMGSAKAFIPLLHK